MQTRQKYEIAVSGLMILMCFVFLWESWDLPPGTFEPLGSGPVPQATAAIIILCCLITINTARLEAKKSSVAEGTGEPLSIGFAVLMALATLVFVIILHLRIMAFAWMAALFLTVTIWGLENFKKKKFLPAVITGLIVGFAVEYLFTQVFVVDLPV